MQIKIISLVQILEHSCEFKHGVLAAAPHWLPLMFFKLSFANDSRGKNCMESNQAFWLAMVLYHHDQSMQRIIIDIKPPMDDSTLSVSCPQKTGRTLSDLCPPRRGSCPFHVCIVFLVGNKTDMSVFCPCSFVTPDLFLIMIAESFLPPARIQKLWCALQAPGKT